MSDERTRRLSELFQAALDVPTAERDAWLARTCGADDALRRELTALLAADAGATAGAIEAAAAEFAGRPRPGDTIAGRYRILAQVGEGGMGVVYAAEQLEPRRRVALKCIRPGWLDPDAERRFRREASALGRLQHPGIAQVFEAGVAPGDPPLPFLAMEFVDGQGLAAYARDLPLRARLELVAAIAEAVGHAHDRGVVHRDLKPSNVLVETAAGAPRVRVLDFGVARLVGDDSGTLHTRTHQLVGTLAYLSPEQIEHGSHVADARSDVWSLGVTTWELLTGSLPLPLAGKSLAAAARMLRDDEPVRLDRLLPALRGDVATIVHKALAKDPARRYADASAFAADLRRHLADQPITARPPGAWYQASRFARRHRGLVAGLLLAFATLVAGLVTALLLVARTAQERDRANQRTRELRDLVRTLVLDVDRELASVPGTTKARRVLLDSGRRHADGMAADAGDDPALLCEVASLYGALAAVQGRASDSSLGEVEGALATLQRGLALLDRAETAAPRADEPLRQRLSLLIDLDSLLRALGRPAERREALDQRAAVAERLAARAPAAAAARLRAETGANEARWLADQGRFADAVPGMRTLRDLLLQDGDASRDDRDKARALTLQLAVLHERLGDASAAAEQYARATQLAEALYAQQPDARHTRDLATTLRAEAMSRLQQKDAAGAEPLLRRAHELLAPLAAADAADIELQRLWRTLEFLHGDALVKLGRTDEGGALLRGYLDGMLALTVRFPDHRPLRRELVPARQQVARLEANAGRFDAAFAIAEAGVAQTAAARRETPKGAQEADDHLMSLGMLAWIAERHAAMPADGIEPAERQRRRTRAADALTAQLQCAQELDAAQLLEPRRRSLLDDLPPRIATWRE